ncbi:hypothetical protein CEY00_Acc32383 [Actinidia chinensis var. chinensis]|uniref:Uncharacterized protein n=1 Tax=Actinidia chinensis var. chinensis TaxID=1590841 RepID=A0A2R6P835_ACTCC|nr:hypothetical protein CEY00_Acc32383 [Actinidia chinensis var. chinensis]
MALAGESSSNGQVMPLKPPPRLQCPSRVYQSSTASLPRSPGSVLRIPFPHRSTWNDEFDPFAVAWENVKDEKRGKTQHRWTRPLSPFRSTNPVTLEGGTNTNTNKEVPWYQCSIKWDRTKMGSDGIQGIGQGSFVSKVICSSVPTHSQSNDEEKS